MSKKTRRCAKLIAGMCKGAQVRDVEQCIISEKKRIPAGIDTSVKFAACGVLWSVGVELAEQLKFSEVTIVVNAIFRVFRKEPTAADLLATFNEILKEAGINATIFALT